MTSLYWAASFTSYAGSSSSATFSVSTGSAAADSAWMGASYVAIGAKKGTLLLPLLDGSQPFCGFALFYSGKYSLHRGCNCSWLIYISNRSKLCSKCKGNSFSGLN